MGVTVQQSHVLPHLRNRITSKLRLRPIGGHAIHCRYVEILTPLEVAEEHGHDGFAVRDVRHADAPNFAKRFGQLLEALALPVQHVVMVAENQMTVIARAT